MIAVGGRSLYCLTVAELDVGVLLLQELGLRLLCMIGADAHGHDGIPSFLRSLLRPQWLFFIVGALVNGVPEPSGPEVDLHVHRPLAIVGVSQCRPTGAADLPHNRTMTSCCG